MTRSTDFSSTVRSGRRVRRGGLVVHHQPDLDPGHPPTVGFVVGRTVGGSVVRHRVTRRLRHIARSSLPALPDGSATVVRALPEAATATSQQLSEDLRSALRRVLSPADDPRATSTTRS